MKSKHDTSDLENFGLHYPLHHILSAFGRYYRSNFMALPDPGGWWDQDAQLMDDFEVLTRLANHHIDRLRTGAAPATPPKNWENEF